MNRIQRLRVRGIAEQLRGSLWFIPALFVLLAVLAAQVALMVGNDAAISRLFPADVDGARGMLVAVAGSVITVTGLVFSLMVVSLQLASQQFSPRLLRTFMRDRGTQVVLGVFLATFAYCLLVLRATQGGENGHVPQFAVAGGFALALASVTALVYFIHHATSEIRVDTILRDVENETRTMIARVYPRPLSDTAPRNTDLVPPAAAVPLPAPRSGFIQDVTLDGLSETARTHDLLLCLHRPVGDYVVAGAPLLWVWTRDEGRPDQDGLDEVVGHAPSAVQIGHERTQQGDVAFGIRQLVDVAVKALSPAINDPTTAVHAIGRLSGLLWTLAGRRLEPIVGHDADGTVRATVPSRSFAEYLDVACGQIRRNGASEPAVTTALLDMLTVVAGSADDADERAGLQREADLVLSAAREATIQKADLAAVEAAGEAFARALGGDHRP
jgi:uncharacterized membrane protein